MDQQANLMNHKAIKGMDDIFQNRLKERQDAYKQPKTYDEIVNPTQAQLKQQHDDIETNLENAAQTIYNNIMNPGSEVNKTARANMDVAYNFVFDDAQDMLKKAKIKVKPNIDMKDRLQQLGLAQIADHMAKVEYIPIETAVNKPAIVAEEKSQKKDEDKKLAKYSKSNDLCDLNTVRELTALEKYQSFKDDVVKRFMDGKYDSIYSDKKLTAEQRKGYADHIAATAMPFLKAYKKGWFGRIYDMSGKRIQLAEGEESPEEYNRKLIETLSLVTTQGAASKQTIEENRKKKAELLSSMAMELMTKKIDAYMLTDEYLADHIIEMQQYADQLNAFMRLTGQNLWFRMGFDPVAGQKKLATDEFVKDTMLIRINGVADRLNAFLEKHYMAHCIYREEEGRYDKMGGYKDDVPDFDNYDYAKNIKGTLYEGDEKFARDQHALAVNGYRATKQKGITSKFVLFKKDGLTEEERGAYNTKVSDLRVLSPIKETIKSLANNRRVNSDRIEVALHQEIDKTVKGFHDESHAAYNADKEAYKKETKKEIVWVDYDKLNNWEGGKALFEIKQKIKKSSGMYLLYGPEIEHLYARIYASISYRAMLKARKAAIEKELVEDKEFHDGKRKSSPLAYHTENPYAAGLDRFMTDELRGYAATAVAEIDKKLAFMDESTKLCEKALQYFLDDPEYSVLEMSNEDMLQIRNFLKREKLDHMFDVTKADDYNRIMDDALHDMRQTVAKKDNKNADVSGIKKEKTKIKRDMRPGLVFSIRERKRKNDIIKETFEKKKKEDLSVDEKLRLTHNMIFSDIGFDIKKLDYEGKITVKDEADAGQIYNNNMLERYANEIKFGKPGGNQLTMEDIRSRSKMKERYLAAKGSGAYKDSKPPMTLERYMARVRAKVEIISAHKKVSDAIMKIQSNPEYPFFDMSRITGLTLDELETLVTSLEKKEAEYEKKKKSITVDSEEAKSERKLIEVTATGITNLKKMVTAYQDVVKGKQEYSNLTEETISNKAREYENELMLEKAKDEEFRFATNKFISIKTFLTSKDSIDQRKKYGGWLDGIRDFRIKKENKDKPFPEELENQVLKGVNEAMGLDIKTLTSTLDTFLKNETEEKNKDAAVDSTALTNLMQAVYVIDAARSVNVFKADDSLLFDYQKDMMAVLNKPNYLGLKENFLKKMAVLDRLYDSISAFLKSQNMDIHGNLYNQEYGRDFAGKLSDKDVQLANEKNKKRAEKALEKLKKEAEEYQQGKIEEQIMAAQEKIFTKVYEQTKDISLLDEKKWLDTIKKMAEDSKDKKKETPAAEESEEVAAMDYDYMAILRILDHWPYSFEQFYTRRITADTGDAITEELKYLLGEEGKTLISEKQAERIGQMSKAVSKFQTMGYHALHEDLQMTFDRVATANNYDKRLIKYLFRDVNVNGVNMPVNAEDRKNREANVEIANGLIEMMRNGLYQPENKSDQYFKAKGAIASIVNDVIAGFDIKEEMLNEAYIEKNFEKLYEISAKIDLLAMLYEKDKGAFAADKLLDMTDNAKEVSAKVKEVFGIGKNKLYIRFSSMIKAYMHKNLLDETGSFDLGLTNEDLLIEDAVKGKFFKGRAKGRLRKENYAKVREELTKRHNEFNKNLGFVDAEFSREKIAKMTKRTVDCIELLNPVEIKGDDKMFSLQGYGMNGGHISDFSLLIQDELLRNRLDVQIKRNERMAELNHDLGILTVRIAKEKDPKKKAALEKERDDKAAERNSISDEKEGSYQTYFYDCTQNAINYHKTFQLCHDKDGKVLTKQQTEKGKVDLRDRYLDFHVVMAPQMRKIFNEFVAMYKAHGEGIFDERFVVNQMKGEKWDTMYTNYKRLNLYASMIKRETDTGSHKQGWFSNELTKRHEAREKLAKSGIKDSEKKINGKRDEIKKLDKEKEKCKNTILDLKKKKEKLLENLNKESVKRENGYENAKVVGKVSNLREQVVNAEYNFQIQEAEQQKKIAEADRKIAEANKEIENLEYEKTVGKYELQDYADARFMMDQLRGDDNNKVLIDKFHDYVRKIETTLASYLITADGRLMTDDEAKQQMMETGMTEEQQSAFLYNLADKAFQVNQAK